MVKVKDFFIRNRMIFAAFFLPALITVIALAATGIYPFGENQIAVIDMYHQYVPFLSELQYKLQSGGSLFYTWNGAGGSNFWNLLSYYGASPLNLLLIFFPQKYIMEAVTVILIIKIGLSGSFMAMYLRYQSRGANWATVAFATLYALSAYVMAYYWCIMWLDAVALLPLCMLGLNRLIDDGRAVMYTLSLALTVFCSYYMGIMVCIFIFFYYPVLYFTKKKWNGIRKCAVTTGKAAGFSVLGICMAAVMLLPTYISMQTTYYISSEMPETTTIYEDALDIVNQLLPYSELTYRDGLPNLCCGMFVVILLVFYILSKSISIKEKALNGFFLVFIFFSLNINKLDFIWHGMHFPNQLPYRYTFAVCFVLIAMAYNAFRRIDEVKISTIGATFAAGVGYYLIAQKLLTDNIENPDLFIYGGIAWLACYCGILLLYKKELLNRKSLVVVVAIAVAAEMSAGMCNAFNTVGNTSRNEYFENYGDVTALAEEANEDFSRTEIDYNYILNCPALYHYRGMSQFSSSINANATALMEKIGLEGAPEKNRYNYNLTNPVTNAMLNIKYIIGKNTNLDDNDFYVVGRSGDSKLYESEYPLSIGYMTGFEIRTWDTDSENPFEVLDSYVRAATSNEYDNVFSSVVMSSVDTENASAESEADETINVQKTVEEQSASVSMEYEADATQKYYVFIEASNASSITVNKGRALDEIDIRSDSGSIVNIGTIEEGSSFTVKVDYDDDSEAGYVTCHVCTLDYEAWDAAYDIISENMMTVEDSGDTYIKGSVNADEAGILVTSVIYEEGWTLKVDGKRTQIDELTGGVFISTALDEGTHEIELTFRPPGIVKGGLISLVSILLLIFFTMMRKRRVKRDELFEELFADDDKPHCDEMSESSRLADEDSGCADEEFQHADEALGCADEKSEFEDEETEETEDEALRIADDGKENENENPQS